MKDHDGAKNQTRTAHTLPTKAATRDVEILLVEDNPDDIELTLEALHESRVATKPHVARDGEEALAFLRKQGKFEGAPTPDVIFLDLNMPKKNGREVLQEVKADPRLRHIPVVVLTTSSADADILKSYQLQAAAYVVKPVDFDQFLQAIRAIDDFWLKIVTYARSA